MLVWFRPLSQHRTMAKTPHRRTTLTTAIPVANTGNGQRLAPLGINAESIFYYSYDLRMSTK
ncbi:hypothetical protein MTBBW1_170007 [Desulfamplus magnetovallimortis]|uniref:Uncharacterized protein n=1 Tax=Desulfamplus magnetovallimortis TaxID=1246637 RepID=A0A1W1H9K7_9BACT|nr:hypothetical protein MTBBW1_170007 [Desulfamplus magnetovallimortis]